MCWAGRGCSQKKTEGRTKPKQKNHGDGVVALRCRRVGLAQKMGVGVGGLGSLMSALRVRNENANLNSGGT